MVIVLVKSYDEWVKNKTYHKTYVEYRDCMKAVQEVYKKDNYENRI